MNSHSVPLHVLVRVTNGEKESTVAAMHRIEDRSFHDSAQLIKLNATQRNSTQLNFDGGTATPGPSPAL